MNIAIIPARGGSKRIPRKNIKEFCGKPIIAWSIETAKASSLFDRIIVSTNDQEIASVSKDLGAEVPFMRPEELSDDFAGTTEVIAHATQWAIDEGLSIDAVCCIYAAAPLIQIIDMGRGLESLNSGDWNYAFSATDFPSSIFRAFKEIDGGGIEMFSPEYFQSRTQDLPLALHDAAQFYWGRPQAWLEDKSIFDRHSKAILIPRWRTQDIDTLDDWDRAEIIFKILQKLNHTS